MTDYSLEDRIKRRLLMEDPDVPHNVLGGIEIDMEGAAKPLSFVRHNAAARIAALEAEDTVNPLAATAIVRKDAVTEIAPPDVEALLAAFNRREEDQ